MMQNNKKCFNVGDVICKSKPYVHILMHRYRDKRCEECLCRNDSLKKCCQCGVSRYCNRVCQKKAWKYHKDECSGFVRISPMIPKDSTVLLFRLIRKSKSDEGKSELEEILGRRRTFFDLESHAEDIRTDRCRYAEFLQITQSLAIFAGDKLPPLDQSELLDIFGKMTINTFSICCGEMQPIGAGLYLGPSSFDHSCSPNACATFNGAKLTTRCTQSIQAGQPITLAYIDVLKSTVDRQSDLASTYYFRCSCVVCQDTHRNQLMNCSRCPSVSCHGRVLYTAEGRPMPCTDCKFEDDRFTETKVEMERRCVNAMSRHKENLAKKIEEDENEVGGILATCEACLKENVLDPFNIYLVQLLGVAFDVSIDLSLWQRARKYARLLLEPNRLYFPAYHSTIGIHLMKLGKLELFLELIPEAYESLKQAETILAVTHGKEHPLYSDLRELLNDCKREPDLAHLSHNASQRLAVNDS